MKRPQILLRTPQGKLAVGGVPRVVGTFTSAPSVVNKSALPCDIVELRVDQMPPGSDWLAHGRRIEALGKPVIATIRLKEEGGKWVGDVSRMVLFEKALQNLAAVDVELRSKLAADVARTARRLGKACIVSYHDFERTPPLAKLEAVVSEAEKIGSIVKITTMVREPKDVLTLLTLLVQKRKKPVSVFGMGAAGMHTRVSFAALGSCLTYGFLDRPAAPGQLSAAGLSELLREFVP